MEHPPSRRVPVVLAVIFLAANILVYRQIFRTPELSVRVIHAGKGSAVLVTSPTGKTLLINAGSDASILRALGEALPPWQRSLDGLILTNVGSRTSGGMPIVVSRYQVTFFGRPAAQGTSAQERAIERLDFVTLARGDRLQLGGGAHADILWPPRTKTPLSSREGGLAVRITYRDASYLIYDDLPVRVLAALGSARYTISSSTSPGIVKTPSR